MKTRLTNDHILLRRGAQCLSRLSVYLYGRMQVLEHIYSHGAKYIAHQKRVVPRVQPPPSCKNGDTASEKVSDYRYSWLLGKIWASRKTSFDPIWKWDTKIRSRNQIKVGLTSKWRRIYRFWLLQPLLDRSSRQFQPGGLSGSAV